MFGSKPRQRKRVPKLAFTANRDIGWHVAYRDPVTGTPRRHRFGIEDRRQEAKAKAMYNAWVAQHISDAAPAATQKCSSPNTPKAAPRVAVGKVRHLSGSLLEVASGLLELERGRVRDEGEPRRRGTIERAVFTDRKKHIHDFLEFLNGRHGTGAVGRMRLADLGLADVETFNRHLVKSGYSASQVSKRMRIVKAIIDRAGRPEHGQQMLKWNWDSRDVAHGKPTEKRKLPTVDQLERLLAATDLRGKTMIWLGIGLGFGQHDLAAIRVGQIGEDNYDLRRGKTGIERYGETPPLVWSLVDAYTKAAGRKESELLFVTKNGQPLVHGRTDAVTQWWAKLRKKIGETEKTLGGFYTLRHLGATEYGSRPGCSIAAMRRWLGHAASSDMADVYMRPVSPESGSLVSWVREHLETTGSGCANGW